MLRRSFLALGMSREVYELRIYSIDPSKYDAFHTLSMSFMPKRPSVSKCQGYWTSQMGGLNEMVHLWKYDNLEHRYDCRKLLDSDPEWQRSYVKPREECIRHQTNMLLKLVYREGNASTMSYKYLLQFSPEKELELSGPSATLAATFQVIVGEREGWYVHLVKARKLDDVIPIAPYPGATSKLMGPVRWASTIGCLWR